MKVLSLSALVLLGALSKAMTLGDCYSWLKVTGREGPRQVFRIADGLLHITGDSPGSIITNKRYRDYQAMRAFAKQSPCD